jgi:hypothetical protein
MVSAHFINPEPVMSSDFLPAQPIDGGAMLTEAGFATLNEHLNEVRPIFDVFCAQNGFVPVAQNSIGRYPRIRIERSGPVNLWFDLWMEFDQNGQRFELFSRDSPYELTAGANVVTEDESNCIVRFQKAIQCFSGKPFDEVSAILLLEMQKHLPIVGGWDAKYLQANGKKVQLKCPEK